MTAPLKVIIMLVIWVLYSIVAYKGVLEQCCSAVSGADAALTENTDNAATTVAPVKRFPLDFQWSNDSPFTNEGFAELKQSKLADMADNNIFEITGMYFKDEKAPDGFANMGLARAAKIKELFKDIPEDRMSLRARLLDGDQKDGFFESASFRWYTPEEKKVESVEEVADRIIIRFPSNSAQKDVDSKVDDYLDKLAERIIKTGEKVSLTGHADNLGPADLNDNLAKKRAQQIRRILINKGVARDQIVTDSKGESEPVASNDTEEGRHDNRRVEVRLLKK